MTFLAYRTLGIAALIVLPVTQALAASVSSPDGRTEVTVAVSDDGRPQYAVHFDGEPVILPSHLGLVFRENASLDEGLSIVAETTTSADSVWEQPWGERRFVRDRHEELLLSFANPAGARLDLRVRVFDDGLGFRYEIPEQKSMEEFVIMDEVSEFALAEGLMQGDFDCVSDSVSDVSVLEFPPGEKRQIENLQNRILSRLQWGLVADIHPTDYELRLGILQSKAERIMNEDPLPASRLRSHCPEELSVICGKAMEKRPQDRYQSAAEMRAWTKSTSQKSPPPSAAPRAEAPSAGT